MNDNIIDMEKSRPVALQSVLAVFGAVLAIACAGASTPQKAAMAEIQPTAAASVETEEAHYFECTTEELDLIARVISAEARGEPFDGQVAVGAVIINRIEDDGFPDSVTEVCYQSGAFCGVADGQINIEPSESCRRAALAALEGYDPTGGAVYFYNPKTAASDWIRLRPVVVEIGNHWFCV